MSMTHNAPSLPALRAATFAGVGMLVLVILMLGVLPTRLTWMPHGFFTPIYALEFVSDFSMARQMLAKDTTAITAFMQGLQLDNVFLVFYGVFLLGCVWALLEGTPRYIAISFALLAPLGDLAENMLLLQLLDDVAAVTGFHSGSDVNFMALRAAVVVKFAAMAIVMLRLLRVISRRGILGQTLSVLILVNAAATLASFFSVPYAVEVMVNTISLCWVLLWLIVFFSWKATRKGTV